jgi:hypothetical protein
VSNDEASGGSADQVEYSPEKDISIQRYNVAAERKFSG